MAQRGVKCAKTEMEGLCNASALFEIEQKSLCLFCHHCLQSHTLTPLFLFVGHHEKTQNLHFPPICIFSFGGNGRPTISFLGIPALLGRANLQLRARKYASFCPQSKWRLCRAGHRAQPYERGFEARACSATAVQGSGNFAQMVGRQAPIFLQNRASVGEEASHAAQVSPRLGGLCGLAGRQKALKMKIF